MRPTYRKHASALHLIVKSSYVYILVTHLVVNVDFARAQTPQLVQTDSTNRQHYHNNAHQQQQHHNHRQNNADDNIVFTPNKQQPTHDQSQHHSYNHDQTKERYESTSTTTSTTTRQDQNHDDDDFDPLHEISDENKKIFIENVKLNLLKVLGLKEEPKKPTTKAFIPRAILEEYRRHRDSVRESIPDDRDFYGKINLDDIDDSHEDFWSRVYNQYGDYDITVDLGLQDDSHQRLAPQISHLINIPPSVDPLEVPKKLLHSLPSYHRYPTDKLRAVHIKFNLTDGLQKETILDATIKLSREAIMGCELEDRCEKKPVPFFNQRHSLATTARPTANGGAQQQAQKNSSPSNVAETTTTASRRQNNQQNEDSISTKYYQRIYLNQITGYDSSGHPLLKPHDTQRIDVRESSPLVFDIKSIVKEWILDSRKNYGIIVSVGPDSVVVRDLDELNNNNNRNNNNKKKRSTNASSPEQDNQLSNASFLEHVRLTRDFRSTSESYDTWIKIRPSLLISTGADAPETRPQQQQQHRRHVKRDHSNAKSDQHSQLDEGEIGEYTSNSPATTSSSGDDNQQNADNHSSKLDGIVVGSNQQQPSISTTTFASGITSPSAQPPPPSSTLSSLSATTPYGSTTTTTLTSASSTYATGRLRSITTANSTGKRDSRQTNTRTGSASNRSPGALSANQRQRGKGKSSRVTDKCGKRSLSINFDDVGWSSWIIAPSSYDANFCYGDCSFPMSDHQNATNHAIIQSIFHSVGRTIPRSCCVPTKLAKMAILYQIDGVVQMRHYDDMIVESCGCL